jgi:hypothetical protein
MLHSSPLMSASIEIPLTNKILYSWFQYSISLLAQHFRRVRILRQIGPVRGA